MSKKTLSINFPIERVVLSDLLPYEIPITFSNRHFYNFLKDNDISYNGNRFCWRKTNDAIDKLVLLLLGLPTETPVESVYINERDYSSVALQGKDLPSIPFVFSISHKKDQYRYLSLIHPKGQIMAVQFYNKFKNIITYYSDVSPFSLRSAKRVAGCTYIDSKSLVEKFDKDDSSIEIDGQNYENLKSFFVYKKLRNIFEFYESEEHHSSERRFSYLSKLDISHCFDSIYTHSISWAVYKKEFAKKYLSETKKSFPDCFDKLMQQVNYNETNGILIGPEVSRIFAEIILQAIDVEIKDDLVVKGLKLGVDYQVFRYVDDYFVFYNDASEFAIIKSVLQKKLKVFKLDLNKHKEEVYSRPIITPISIAKKKIASLISDRMSYSIEKVDDGTGNEIKKGSIFIHEASLITDFKSILSTSGVTYTDILNYSLAIVEKKIKKILLDYKSIEMNENIDRQLVRAVVSIINFSFFVYSVSPRVNSTIKLCRIMQQIILFVKNQDIGKEYRHVVFKVIFDNSCIILDKGSNEKDTPIETLYLLVLLRQLGKFYWLDEVTLSKYFKISSNDEGLYFEKELSYFSITVLLFYISDKVRYDEIKELLLSYINGFYEIKKDVLLDESEITHLTLDMLACPYVDSLFKSSILFRYNIPKKYHSLIIKNNDFWFTKWDKFDFAKELDAKLGQDVY